MVPIDPLFLGNAAPGPRRWRAALAASALALLSSGASAAEWIVRPSIGLRETYSDNIGLTSRDTAQSDWITELIPAIAVNGSARRFKLNAAYELHYIDYLKDNAPSRTLHIGNVAANAEFVSDLLFADAAANVSQQRISAFGRQSTDFVNATGNTAEVQTYSLSPYLRHRFSDFASTELRYTAQKTKTNLDQLIDANSRRVFFDVSSGTGFRNWGWGFQADHQRVDYSIAPPVELGRYTARYRYLLTPRLALETSAGYEDNNYIAIGPAPRGAFWSAGFAWNPSEVNAFSAHVGHRYFGTTFDVTANHRSRLAAWTLSYKEDVVTQGAAPTATGLDTAGFLDQLWKSTIPDDAARKTVVDTFIRNAHLPATLTGNIYGLSNRVYLQKYLPATLTLTGIRNTVVLRLSGLRREPLSAPAGALAVPPVAGQDIDDDYLQLGASAAWDWQLSPRSHFVVGADYSRIRSFTVDRIDYIRSFRAALSSKLATKTSASLELRRQQRWSPQPGADYVENAISLFILMLF